MRRKRWRLVTTVLHDIWRGSKMLEEMKWARVEVSFRPAYDRARIRAGRALFELTMVVHAWQKIIQIWEMLVDDIVELLAVTISYPHVGYHMSDVYVPCGVTVLHGTILSSSKSTYPPFCMSLRLDILFFIITELFFLDEHILLHCAHWRIR